jgi:long-chain acyl-CoA synthetase
MAVGGSFDTFPKLLVRNAAQFSSRPAFRYKDLGIWQTWTWAQVAEIVRAYAAGLRRLGLQPGDTIAIVGSNRPKLYWTLWQRKRCARFRFRSIRMRWLRSLLMSSRTPV